jgi:hypothetical protein
MLAANAGANLRERMGHSTTRAATVYLHGSTERQQAIADELSRQTAQLLAGPRRSHRARNGHPTGTATADCIMTACPISGKRPTDLGF